MHVKLFPYLNAIILLISLFLFSCATIQPPSEEQFKSADYGSYPNNHEDLVKKFMSQLLYDPYSVVYSDWLAPKKGWYGSRGGDYEFGYYLCFKMNAKNKLGGFVGVSPFYVFVRNGSVIRYQKGGGSYTNELVYKVCGNF